MYFYCRRANSWSLYFLMILGSLHYSHWAFAGVYCWRILPNSLKAGISSQIPWWLSPRASLNARYPPFAPSSSDSDTKMLLINSWPCWCVGGVSALCNCIIASTYPSCPILCVWCSYYVSIYASHCNNLVPICLGLCYFCHKVFPEHICVSFLFLPR